MVPIRLCSEWRVAATSAGGWLARLIAVCLVTVPVRAAYDGPVPRPVDAFGGPGPFAVASTTIPSPEWPGQEVTVFQPANAPGPRPVWFFAHGFSGTEPAYYRELLEHLASHGSIVVFSPYPANPLQVAQNYETLYQGFRAAVERFGGSMDTTRVGFAGHSYGGGAVPALALRALHEAGWGGNGVALLILAPWFSFFVDDADLRAFPPGTQAVIQVYEDDLINDHRMAVDLFHHLGLAPDDKAFLTVHSDRIEGYNYVANHRVPTGAAVPREDAVEDALDAWAVHRLAQALTASAFANDLVARRIALGGGDPLQVSMGSAGERPLRPMTVSAAPRALYPSSRYAQPFDLPLNPRRSAARPADPSRPRLVNLAARARLGAAEKTLILGAGVEGTRPKALLLRVAGPALDALDVPDFAPDPALTVYRGARLDLSIGDWAESPDPAALAAATAETGAFAWTEGSRDAAVLASFAPGPLTVHATHDGRPGIALVEVYDAEQADDARLTNLSARGYVDEGSGTFIAGFVVRSSSPVRLLLRGVGPGLVPFGIERSLADPVLEFHGAAGQLAANDDWSDSPAAAAEVAQAAALVGAFPLAEGSADAALLVEAAPGAYTAHLRPQGAAGIGLLEVYLLP